MRIAVGVLTHNVLSSLRSELLDRTLASVHAAFPSANVLLFDNNSTDGSQAHVMDLGGVPYQGGNGTPGAGRIAMAEPIIGHASEPPDLVVFSDDDMEWKEGAEETLLNIWSQAPADLVIVSGLLEPVWHWNTPRETIRCAQTNVLVRDSCPGAAWSFRAADWGIIKRRVYDGFGYDHKACVALRAEGYRVGQVDLADHIGWGYSTHGNEANSHLDGRPLDRQKWGV